MTFAPSASYSQFVDEIEGTFADPEWTALGLVLYPSNFDYSDKRPAEYLVLEILPSDALTDSQWGGGTRIGGLLIIQIYIPVNTGSRRVYAIADNLDDVLQKKVLGYNIQTGGSSIQLKGNDPDNPALFRADYTVRFNSY